MITVQFSTVISGSRLAEDRSVRSSRKAASVGDADAGERDVNQIKRRPKLQLIGEKCLKVYRAHGPEPCHPVRLSVGI